MNPQWLPALVNKSGIPAKTTWLKEF